MSKSKAQFEEEKNTSIQHHTLYRGKNISLRIDTLAFKNRPPATWEIIEHPGAAVILPIDHNDQLILVKQWRRAIGKILIELPAGTLEKGEDPYDCADRELQEETGFKSASLISLGGYFSAPGFCTEYLYFYLARELTEAHFLKMKRKR